MNHNTEYNSKTNTIDLLNGTSVDGIRTLSGVRLKVDGGTSDGYHTFDELYEQRMKLFAIICKQNSDKAWKSLKHHDGKMVEESFIVGVTTDEGDYAYQFHMENWDQFNVKEIEFAPENKLTKKWGNNVNAKETKIGNVTDFFRAMLAGHIAQDESGWYYRLNNNVLEESINKEDWESADEFEFGIINGTWKITENE